MAGSRHEKPMCLMLKRLQAAIPHRPMQSVPVYSTNDEGRDGRMNDKEEAA